MCGTPRLSQVLGQRIRETNIFIQILKIYGKLYKIYYFPEIKKRHGGTIITCSTINYVTAFSPENLLSMYSLLNMTCLNMVDKFQLIIKLLSAVRYFALKGFIGIFFITLTYYGSLSDGYVTIPCYSQTMVFVAPWLWPDWYTFIK